MTTERRRQPQTTGIDPWLRNLVLLIALAGWAATVIGYLAMGKLPDAPLLGIPGAVYFALSPSLPGRRRKPAEDGKDAE